MMGQRQREPKDPQHLVYNAYLITSPDHESKVVFAAGTWSAVGALLQWRVANGVQEAPFTLDPWWASGLTGVAREHLNHARSRCDRPSIGAPYSASSGWELAGPMDKPNQS